MHTLGIRADGTVVAAGYNNDGQCDVGEWADIVQVAAGLGHTVGLKTSGEFVTTGLNNAGQCEVIDW